MCENSLYWVDKVITQCCLEGHLMELCLAGQSGVLFMCPQGEDIHVVAGL